MQKRPLRWLQKNKQNNFIVCLNAAGGMTFWSSLQIRYDYHVIIRLVSRRRSRRSSIDTPPSRLKCPCNTTAQHKSVGLNDGQSKGKVGKLKRKRIKQRKKWYSVEIRSEFVWRRRKDYKGRLGLSWRRSREECMREQIQEWDECKTHRASCQSKHSAWFSLLCDYIIPHF